MEPAQTQATPSTPGLFGTKFPSSIAFLAAALLFLLPFAEIRCNGAAFANNTGVGIAMGTKWNEIETKSLFGTGGSNQESDQKTEQQKPNKFAIAALALAIIGLLVAFFAPRSGGNVNAAVAILAAVSLVAMIIDLKSQAKSDNSIKSSDLGLNAGVSVSVEPTGAFYITIILLILAAFFCWQRSRQKT